MSPTTVLEKVDFLHGADNDNAGNGEWAPVSEEDMSEGGVVPAAERTGAVRSGARNEQDGKLDDEDSSENGYSDGQSNEEPPSGAPPTASATAFPGKDPTAVEI